MKGLLGGLALLGLVGCQSIDDRIAEYQGTFNALGAEEQSNIRQGLVDLGYSPEMVYMALGRPDVRGAKVTEEGRTETWTYRGVRLADYDYPFGHPFYDHVTYYYKGRVICVPRYNYAFSHTPRERYDRIIVEFRDGRAVSISFPEGDIRLPKPSPSPDPATVTTEA